MKLRSRKTIVKHAKINIKNNKYYDIFISNKQKEFYKQYNLIIKENLKNRHQIKQELKDLLK